ncbi:MAG: hypothetical protein ACRCST_01495 [Turicibacter sp.]
MQDKTQRLEIDYLGQKEIEFSKIEHKVGSFYRLNIEPSMKKYINHHILLVDVSNHMLPHFNELYEKLIKTLEALKYGKRNYVSVILFSSHSECFRIVHTVKCDTLSYQMAQVYSTIKQNMYSRSSMILSEAFAMGLELVNNLSGVCEKHQITILTTGVLNPVKWCAQVEVEKCFELAKRCQKQAVYLNVIRFDYTLDGDWLKDLVQTSQTNIIKQVDEIKDYTAMVIQMIKLMDGYIPVYVSILNEDYFIVDEHRRVNQPMVINRMKKSGSHLIVTFDGALQVVENHVMKQEKTGTLDEASEDFTYSQAIHHLRTGDTESAQLAIAKTQDVYAHATVLNTYSSDERLVAIDYLSQLFLHKKKRFKWGKSLIAAPMDEEEPLCLLEVLKMIQEDEESKLLWDYSLDYHAIGMKNNMIEDHLKFLRPTFGYGEVLELMVGQRKLNVGMRVKVKGEVENQVNGLKIDAAIKREYTLIVDGTLNILEIGCQLSKTLRSRFRKEKIIKKIIKHGKQTVYIIALHKLRVTNKRMVTALTQKEIVEKLYETEQLGCEVWAIKKQLNEAVTKFGLSSVETGESSGEVVEVRKAYRVNPYGIYSPLGIEKQENDPHNIYQGTIIEWKIGKFPKKKKQEEAMHTYKQKTNEREDVYLNRLNEAFKTLTKRRQHLLDEVNLVRISSGIMGISVFIFDEIKEKKKMEHDPILNRNAVVDEKMVESQKNIDGITIRQLQYLLRLHGESGSIC